MHNTGDYRGGRRTHIERAPSCCDQLRASFIASLIGLILVPVAICILGYNEVCPTPNGLFVSLSNLPVFIPVSKTNPFGLILTF